MDFSGKVAAVTGGGGGIGRAAAEAFARAGARRVVILDIDGDRAAEAARGIGPRAMAAALDVTHPEATAAAMDWVAGTAGGLDAFVHSAAIPFAAPILETAPADWHRVIAANLTGAFLAMQAAARVMAAKGGGRIVALSSVNGQRAVTGRGAYAAAKGGLEALVRAMAAELAPAGIAVNAVAPGPVDTPMVREMHGPGTRAAWEAATPAGRYATLGEVAEAILWLASPASGFVTGQVLAVDGGFLASGLRLAE